MSRLKPTNDFVFKKIFGQTKNADLLKDLLESILTDMKINEVEVNKDVSLERKIITDKLGILDVVATLDDGTRVDVEMQIKDYYNTVERSLFYGTGVYHENLDSGEDYIDIPRSISIWITDYNVFEDGPFHERARLKRDYENKLLTDKLPLHYIQLPKFKEKCKRISSKLEEWLTFIKNENLEEIRMIDNKYVKKAEEELEYLTGDEETRRLAYLREKAIRDEMAA
ncbi:MAG: Rpn family recombination-promoting nuclease/putative transposase, partial [Clostridia bacterium]|nr:Rpn family recombination-promoting nuclease/putative transposase [Clostridia bacterium]